MYDVYYCTVFGFILIIIFMFFINILISNAGKYLST